MKKIKLILFSLVGLLFLMSSSVCKINNKQTIEQNLIGTWVSEGDSNWEVQFNGSVRKDYYEGVQTDTYQYSVTNSCDSEVLSGSQYFLKSIDSSDGSIYCLVIEGVNDSNSGILSFTSDVGKLLIFNKK